MSYVTHNSVSDHCDLNWASSSASPVYCKPEGPSKLGPPGIGQFSCEKKVISRARHAI
jgi:hypothetical protein